MSILFFNDTATTEIYTLSLHDALPILNTSHGVVAIFAPLPPERRTGPTLPSCGAPVSFPDVSAGQDRKSTRLNYSHANNSYAVLCLKQKHLTGPAHKALDLVTEIRIQS